MSSINDNKYSEVDIQEILKIDPAIKAANDRLEQLMNDPEVMRLYHLREKVLQEQGNQGLSAEEIKEHLSK